MSIQIINVEPHNHPGTNSVARFDVRMKIYGNDYDFPGFTYYEKAGGSWVSGSTKKYEKDGETRYQPFGGFADAAVQKRFLAQIRSEFRKYLEKNPNLDPEPVVTNVDEEIPF